MVNVFTVMVICILALTTVKAVIVPESAEKQIEAARLKYYES